MAYREDCVYCGKRIEKGAMSTLFKMLLADYMSLRIFAALSVTIMSASI